MYRRIMTTITAATIAITGLSAAPARADQDDLARALAALVGIAIIGKIISDNRDDESNAVTRRYPVHPAPVYRPVHPRHVHPSPVHPRPLPRRVDRKLLLPQNCFRSFDTNQGRYQMFGTQCLRRNYRFVRSLPHHCAQRVRTHSGVRHGFDARCLRRAGYSLARG